MSPQDFRQLSSSVQREYTITACDQLSTIPIDIEVVVDLYYSHNGDFFIELYLLRKEHQMLKSDAIYFNDDHLQIYLADIDITVVFDILKKNNDPQYLKAG